MVIVDQQGRRRVAVIGAAAGAAALLAAGVWSSGGVGDRGDPGSSTDDLVVTVPAAPALPAPPPAVWPVGGSGPVSPDGSGAPTSPSPADVAQDFVREYLGLADATVRQRSPAEAQVGFDVVRADAEAAAAGPVASLVLREVSGAWAVTAATSTALSLHVEAAGAGALTVRGRAPAGQWVEAMVREGGGDFLELARAGAQVGTEGVYALGLRPAPAHEPGGAVVVTTRRGQFFPVDAVAVVPVALSVEHG